MTDIVITEEHNEYRLGGTLALLNVGAGFAGFHIYGNTRAATPLTAAGAAPLVTIYLADPAGVIDNGLLTLTADEDALIDFSGTATWARAFNGAGSTVFDCDVSNTAGTATVKLPSILLYAGGLTRIVSGVLG